jgi:hypothetical protein
MLRAIRVATTAIWGLLLVLSPVMAEQPTPNAGVGSAIPEAVIASSALTADWVAKHSSGKYQEPAFARLPPTTYFTLAYKNDWPILDQLTRALQLFGHVAGIETSFPTTQLHLHLVVDENFSEKARRDGASYVQSWGIARKYADVLAEPIGRAGNCYAVTLNGERGFIFYGVAFVDPRVGDRSESGCTAGILFTLFGLQNTPLDDRSTDMQRLLLLREVYAIETNEPFRELTLERIKKNFEYGRTCVRSFRVWPKDLPGPGAHPPEWCRPS